MPVKNVLMISPEYYGYVMTGGLAMAVHGLSRALHRQGIDVRVVIPSYSKTSGSDKFLRQIPKVDIKTAMLFDDKGIRIYQVPDVFLDPLYTYFISRDIEDSVHRRAAKEAFLAANFFSSGIPVVLEHLAKEYSWTPDVIHLHEWPTASASESLRRSKFSNIPIVVTTHNAQYIGRVPPMEDKDLILSQSSPQQVRVLQAQDQLFASLLEMGVFFSDAVTTVSESYAQELLAGMNVDPRVRKRLQDKGLEGILNGLDHQLMNPAIDPYVSSFDPNDIQSVAYGKGRNKLVLHSKYKVTAGSDEMQVTMMGRLADQKGIDLVLSAAAGINGLHGLKLLVVGETQENRVRQLLSGKLGINITGSLDFAKPEDQHLILAGSDAILMPSRYEPCGYVQLEGMRYGAIPIVTHVGGLKDTVVPFDGNNGYGVIIREATPEHITNALREALQIFQNKERWRIAVMNALKEDFAWDGPRNSVGKYVQLYERVKEQRAA